MKNKTRKFKFIGYGDRLPYSGDSYEDMNSDTHYFFTSGVFTEGKVYEAEYIDDYDGDCPADGAFFDDEDDLMVQELQFFEEVLE